MKPGADKAIDAALTEVGRRHRRGVRRLRRAARRHRPPQGVRHARRPADDASDDKSWMASISKIMSGTLMMTFVDQGLVKLDDPVGAYLPAFDGVTTNKPLTIRRLYNHTDGLDEHWGNDASDMEERMAALAPYLEVGKFYRYNGTGLELGAKVMEAVSGQIASRYLQGAPARPARLRQHRHRQRLLRRRSVPADMAQIGQMLLNKGAYGDMRFMSEETFEKMLPLPIKDQIGAPTPEEYGVGTSWAARAVGPKAFGHGAASSATFIVAPTLDMVIVMTRNAAGRNFQKLQRRVPRRRLPGIADPLAVESTEAE